MKISFSSILKRGSHISYEIAPKSGYPKGSRLTIVSCDLNNCGDSHLESTLGASIDDNIISLTVNDQELAGKLRIGNKSINQLKLRQIGCCIPDTVILDFSFSDIYKKDGKIDLEEVFNQHIAKELGHLLAIRCSSNLEDSESQSFAGEFDTYLDVDNDFTAFRERVLRSYKRFCSADNLPQHIRDYELKLAIMVQRMVKTRFSGFLFTEDPMNPPNMWLKIEYWRGKREKSNGYAITLNRESGKRISSSQDDSRVPLPLEHQDKLFHIAKKVHAYHGFPQDVEFVFDDNGRLYVVQSRPITAFSYSPHKVRLNEQNRLLGILEESHKLYQRNPILSSTNISELFVRAVPLGYSIFKYGFAGTHKKEGGISKGRSRLGYAKLDRKDQVKFFYTIGDQARTNIIVDSLTFRLPGVSKADYLNCFVTHYLERIEQNPAAAIYPENGLYLQNDQSERWREIAGEKGHAFQKEYSDFLKKIITLHAPTEYNNAGAFLKKTSSFIVPI